MKKGTILIIGIACGIILYFMFNHGTAEKFKWKYNEPVTSLYFTEFEENNKVTYILEDQEKIGEIIKIFELANKTRIDSVSDMPHQDSFILVEINQINGARRSIYYDKKTEYLEMPYEKLYRMEEGSIEKVKSIYRKAGNRVVETNVKEKG